MELWKMTKAEYEKKYGKSKKNTTVTGGFSPHKSAVEVALTQGKPVPKEVLADYPELKENFMSRAAKMLEVLRTPLPPENDILDKKYWKWSAKVGNGVFVVASDYPELGESSDLDSEIDFLTKQFNALRLRDGYRDVITNSKLAQLNQTRQSIHNAAREPEKRKRLQKLLKNELERLINQLHNADEGGQK